MTPEDLKAELEREPFLPLRLHLVSGKTVDVPAPDAAWMMRHTVLVFQNLRPSGQRLEGYDVIALRNIERIEQVMSGRQQPMARQD